MFYSCKSENPVTPENQTYSKINNVQSGNTNIEIWSATGSNLYYGYNDIGFKVFKYKPLMIHFPGQTGHSTPTSSYFYYNSTYKLFKGYICFNMLSDSGGQWTGYYNYNNQNNIDSIPFNVFPSSAQMLGWDDIQGGNTYFLTLLKPYSPKLGLNDFECLLHRDIGNNEFAEVDSAQMIIKPWMPLHGHGSSNNVNPVSQGSGRYLGKANFTMLGDWLVYDTIKVNNIPITKDKTPKFNFDVQ
ncbi:MAG: FixH family protein [Ignavibacteriae bacterium]|nr:FixH family protein [Ignavibacteriota bacterium]